MQVPPWINYIPSFMRIDEELLQEYLSPQSRFTDGIYRIRSTFTHVLIYSQYLSLVLPLLVFTIWKSYRSRPIVAILLLALVLQTIWFMNARTAILSFLFSVAGFAGLSFVRLLFFRRGNDPIISSITALFIVMAVGMGAGLIASSHRLQLLTVGGAQHSASDDTRDAQWRNAWAQLARNPIGIGIENAQDRVGVPVGDKIVLDSSYINLLVGVGPLGFIGFLGCMARGAYLGILTFLRATEPEDEYGGVAALGLINLIIVYYVISHFDNSYLSAFYIAAAIALHRAQSKRLAAQAQERPSAVMPGRRAIVPA